MVEGDSERRSGADGYVAFATTGTVVTGAYHCSACGYGVTVSAALPACPMCAGTTWEPYAWSALMQPSRLQ